MPSARASEILISITEDGRSLDIPRCAEATAASKVDRPVKAASINRKLLEVAARRTPEYACPGTRTISASIPRFSKSDAYNTAASMQFALAFLRLTCGMRTRSLQSTFSPSVNELLTYDRLF